LQVLIGQAGPALSSGRTKFVYRDINGRVHKVVAATSAIDHFVNKNLIALDDDRERIIKRLQADMDRVFARAFEDREKAVNDYADWFFEWKRSYVILKEAIKSTAANLVKLGKYESVKEAVEHDIKDYFYKNYKSRVLKPEMRDRIITASIEKMARRAHEMYRLAIARSDKRMQAFLAENTFVLADLPANEKATRMELDWDAQKWKAPAYMIEDKAFEGVVGVGTVAVGGTIGVLALEPIITQAATSSFGAISRTFAASMATRAGAGEAGAAVGTAVAPGIGTAIGAGIGLVVGAGADYLLNKRRERLGRGKFIKANNEALDLTIAQWKKKLGGNLEGAVGRWFEDARNSMILSHQGLPAPKPAKQQGGIAAPVS
jgi:hypothetical protein